MKRFMLNTFLLTLAVALWGCGGSDNDDTLPAPAVSITVSQTSISSPASGGTYTVNVTTTGKEWGAYADKDFIKLDMKNSAAQSGTLTVTVPANPNTSARTGTVTVMSPRGLPSCMAGRVRQGFRTECQRLDPRGSERPLGEQRVAELCQP